jgi:phytoene dehydrogenase-like protein
MNKKIIIIGAGIAGLSAGCYGQMNGYDTEIIEMQGNPGGLCTAWKRNGYTFDGCIHYLVGTNPQSMLYPFWKELGAFDGKEIIQHDLYMQIEGERGKALTLYSDIDRLEGHMLELSPNDADLVREFTDAIRKLSQGDDGYLRIRRIGMAKFAQEFTDPFLQEALSAIKNSDFFLSTMASFARKDAGWPVGGSLEFARGIEQKYLSLGGHIKYDSRITSIAVENDRAVGVTLADGSTLNADYIISTTDGFATIFRLLQGKYIDDSIKTLYSRAKTSPTSVQVSLGVDYDLSDQPHNILVKTAKPILIGGEEKKYIHFNNYSFDPTMCPPGKSVVTTLISSSYEYWDGQHKNTEKYEAKKKEIADAVITVFEKRYPMARGKIETIDVVTPVTYTHYTDAWKGSYMGWLSTPQYPVRDVPSTLPGLEGFSMAGQWTYPRGGLPTAMMTGRGSIMKLCAEDGRTFVAPKE